jgi:pyruvate, water dikinase
VSFYWLEHIQSIDLPQVGEQAIHLQQLWQQGYPVQPSFVIPACYFQDWLDSLRGQLELETFEAQSSHDLQAISQRIQNSLTTSSLPEDWTSNVLPALEQLGAKTGLLSPSLTIPGLDTAQISQLVNLWSPQVFKAEPQACWLSLQQVWAECLSAKNLVYWQWLQIPLQSVRLAVIVHPLYPTLCSGWLQSDVEETRVQASWGLNLALSEGAVNPAQYRFNATRILSLQENGHQSIVYCLKDPTSLNHLIEGDELPLLQHPELGVYALRESLQGQSVLSPLQLQQLEQLLPQQTLDSDHAIKLAWSFCWAPPDSLLHLYITHLEYPAMTSIDELLPVKDTVPVNDIANDRTGNTFKVATTSIWRGLAASGGRAIAPAWIVDQEHPLPLDLPNHVILVVSTLSINWLSNVQQIAGLVTEWGGMTSHGAIVARELGIPAVVGVVAATQQIQSGDLLLIDGNLGEVRTVQAEDVCVDDREQESMQSQTAAPVPAVNSGSNLEHETLSTRLGWPPIATQLFVNVSHLSSIERVKQLPIDGVGLVRSELLFFDSLSTQSAADYEQPDALTALNQTIQTRLIQICRAFEPNPVFYRFLDWNLSSLPSQTQEHKNEFGKSVLGVHGTFSYQFDSRVFDLELSALSQVQLAGHRNLHLILPFVRTLEEFQFCQARIQQSGLIQKGAQLWIMAEVPCVLFLLPDYVKAGVQGIAIGTNDLTQLLLGVDRNNPLFSDFNARHPAVLQAIACLIQQAQDLGIPCSICGDAPARYPDLIHKFVAWGVTAISVDLAAVEPTYQAIARAEQQIMLQMARIKKPIHKFE